MYSATALCALAGTDVQSRWIFWQQMSHLKCLSLPCSMFKQPVYTLLPPSSILSELQLAERLLAVGFACIPGRESCLTAPLASSLLLRLALLVFADLPDAVFPPGLAVLDWNQKSTATVSVAAVYHDCSRLVSQKSTAVVQAMTVCHSRRWHSACYYWHEKGGLGGKRTVSHDLHKNSSPCVLRTVQSFTLPGHGPSRRPSQCGMLVVYKV